MNSIRRAVSAAIITPIGFAPNHRLGSKSAVLNQVKGGKFVSLTGPLDY